MKNSSDSYGWWDAYVTQWVECWIVPFTTAPERQRKAEALRRQFRVVKGGKV